MRKSLSILLLLCMLIGMFGGVSAFASESEETTETVTAEEAVEEVEEEIIEEPTEETAAEEPVEEELVATEAELVAEVAETAEDVAEGGSAEEVAEDVAEGGSAEEVAEDVAEDGAGYVCKIGNTKYATVAAALATADRNHSKIIEMIADSTENLVIYSFTTITLDLNGYVLKGTGQGCVIENNGTLMINDSNSGNRTHYFTVGSDGLWTLITTPGEAQKNEAVALDALIDVPAAGTIIAVTGGVITGGNGSGIQNRKGNFYMSGGNICGNKADSGGGIYNKGGTVDMSGGSICGNKADSGGGISNSNWYSCISSFSMSCGKIVGNTAGINGGGVYDNGTITLGGNIAISGNKVGTTNSNVYLLSGKTITLNTPAWTTPIGVTTQTAPSAGSPVSVTDSDSADYCSYFSSDDASYVVINNSEGNVQLSSEMVAKNMTTGTYYTTVSAAVAEAATGETIQLITNVRENITIDAEDNITLDLHGFVLSAPTTGGSVITNNGMLTIQDSSSGKTHYFTVGEDGLWTLDEAGGTMSVTGGCITGGNAENGGGVYNTGGTLIIAGGTICGNTASNGGGVYSFNAPVNVTGTANITGNTATGSGGGVYITGGDAAVIVYNSAKITGNTKDAAANNLYLPSGKHVNAMPGFTGSIGITTENAPSATSPISITGTYINLDYSKYFFSDKESNDVVDVTSGVGSIYHQLKLVLVSAKINETGKKYATVQATVNAAKSGETVTLLKNSSENVTVAADDNITLDLNGFVLSAKNARTSVITNNGTLTLKDSNSGNQTHYFTVGESGLWKWDDNSTSNAKALEALEAHPATGDVIAVSGGCITGCTSTVRGGGIYNDNSTLTISGGNIIGNYASCGGGVAVDQSCTVSMTGGNIAGNTAYTLGAGVYIEEPDNAATNPSSFTMSGGMIIANTSAEYGGGVVIGSAVFGVGTPAFTLQDNGVIAYNEAYKGGGLTNYGRFTMTGGKIIGNVATTYYSDGDGGGMEEMGKLSGGWAIITGGEISGNTADRNGGGIYVGGTDYLDAEGSLTLGGTVKITGNKVGTAENNVYLSNGKTVTISTDTAPTTMSVGVMTQTVPTAKNPVSITGKNANDKLYAQYFRSDRIGFLAKNVLTNDDKIEVQLVKIGSDTFDKIVEITGLDGYTEKTAAEDAVITLGEGTSLHLDDLNKVFVNNKELVRDTDYKAEEGCIKITLYKSYLNTLAAGKYTLTVELTNGLKYETAFTVAAAPAAADTTATAAKKEVPSTGDNNTLGLWIGIASVSVIAMGAVLSIKRKES